MIESNDKRDSVGGGSSLSPACTLLLGDCLEVMKDIPDGSIDAIITDPPYGTTACKWDSIIPLEPMWGQLKRVIKPNGAIVMTASQPFTTTLIASNMKMFKYCWVWDKRVASNSQLAKIQPLKIHEDICVFGVGRITYNPQGLTDCNISKSNKNRSKGVGHVGSESKRESFTQTKTGYPKSIQNFKPNNIGKMHPTQKPVALMEYLIKTYTNENETVLDFAMGSGTTGVACKNLNRNFIGIEKEEKYFNISKDRISLIPKGGGNCDQTALAI